MSATANPFASVVANIRPVTEAEAATERRRERIPQLKTLLASWDLPPARLSEVASWVREPRLLEATQSWSWGGGGVLLAGPTGAGKTAACLAGVMRLLLAGASGTLDRWERARRIVWADAAELGQSRRRHGYGRGEAPEVVRASRCPLLVLDDLGWEADRGTVREVIAARYKRGLPTWTTTGLPVAGERGLEGAYGDAVVRRLVECRGRRGKVVEA